MKKLTILHSFWTRPLQNNMYGVDRLKHLIGDVWMFSLSLAYLLREGFEAEIHTDSLGASLLGHLPYKDVHLTLDCIPQEVNPRFWAAGKVWALEASDANSVHIDGDVFIKSKELLKVEDDVDYIVQNIEDWGGTYWNLFNHIESWREFMVDSGLNPDNPNDFNMGVIGIFNPTLRAAYLSRYKDIVIKASNRFDDILNSDAFLTPDLFVEQLHFYQLASEGYKGKLVIPQSWDGKPLRDFQHLVTNMKYDVIDKVKETLRVFFPEIYNKTLKICQNI